MDNNDLAKNIIDVSVIIVNWNSKDHLQKTIECLYKHTKDINFELIVVDNNSNKQDLSLNFINTELKNYDNARAILNKRNLGFAKANNMAINISFGRHVFLLNPDVVFESNVAKQLSTYLDNNSEVGMVGPKVLNIDGSFQNILHERRTGTT